MPARKLKQVRRVRWCVGYVVRPLEVLQDLGLADSVPPWYSPLKPKTVYGANNAQAFWYRHLSICRAPRS